MGQPKESHVNNTPPTEEEKQYARRCFGDKTDEGIMRFLREANQRTLVQMYKQVYSKTTSPHNNAWLRKQLLFAVGLPTDAKVATPDRSLEYQKKLPKHRRDASAFAAAAAAASAGGAQKATQARSSSRASASNRNARSNTSRSRAAAPTPRNTASAPVPAAGNTAAENTVPELTNRRAPATTTNALPGITTGKRSLERPVKPKRINSDEEQGYVLPAAAAAAATNSTPFSATLENDGSAQGAVYGGTEYAHDPTAVSPSRRRNDNWRQRRIDGTRTASPSARQQPQRQRQQAGQRVTQQSRASNRSSRRRRGSGGAGTTNQAGVLKASNPKYGEEILGQRLGVYWEEELQFFTGVVASYDNEKGTHHIVYDDGDEEDVQLETESFYFEREPESLDFGNVANVCMARRESCTSGYVVLAKTASGGVWPAKIQSTSPTESSGHEQPVFHVHFFSGSEDRLPLEHLADFGANFDLMWRSCSSNFSPLTYALMVRS